MQQGLPVRIAGLSESPFRVIGRCMSQNRPPLPQAQADPYRHGRSAFRKSHAPRPGAGQRLAVAKKIASERMDLAAGVKSIIGRVVVSGKSLKRKTKSFNTWPAIAFWAGALNS